MDTPLNVNEVLNRLDELSGEQICIVGAFRLGFEECEICDITKNKQLQDGNRAVWLTFDERTTIVNAPQLSHLNCRHVIVRGTLLKPDPEFGGCGHLGAWPAEIHVQTIERA